MTIKKQSTISPEKLAAYEKLVASISEIKLKGDTNPYTSHNGNMFTILASDGVLSFRLPEKEREEFIKKYKTQLRTAYGVVLKEYVVVPDSLLTKPKELKKYFDISYSYVKTLKPKPTKKSK
jgi:hypothetical protein